MAGKLGFRVFFISLIFLVVPLILFGWMSYLEDYYFRKKVLFLGLSSIGSGKTRFAEEMIQDKLNMAELLTSAIGTQGALGGVELSKDVLNQMLKEISLQKNTDSAFYQQKKSTGEFICTLSAEPGLIGRKDLFRKEQLEALQLGQSVFLGSDPVEGLKEIFITKAVYSGNNATGIGTLTIGLDAKVWLDWIALVTTAPIHFQLSLQKSDGSVFINQEDRFDAHNAWLFTIDPTYDSETLYNQILATPEGQSYMSFFGAHKRWLGIRMQVPGTSFYLLIHAPADSVSVIPSSALVSRLFNAGLIFLVIGGGLSLLLTIRISRPLNALFHVMGQVERGNLLARYHKDRMGFEINALGHTFNRMLDAVIHHIEEARTERMAREILSKELKIGHDIQRSILPREKPDFPGVSIATGFQGAQEVAGDFYDMFVTEKNDLVCAIADAAGKGISACLYSFLVRSMLRSFASVSDLPTSIVEQTNALFCKDTADSGNFVTAWVGLMSAGTRKLHYVSCGHLPALLKRANGALEELTTEGMALGVMPNMQVQAASVELSFGDVLILYTDGITDAQNSYFELFGKERFLEVVRGTKHKNAQELVDAVLESVDAFSQGHPPFDDRTLLVLQMTEPRLT
ncbi:MAG: SpoIIE family protein phosphatase [Rhabdochlamydiaceae bacterium]|nr:SpoIIE family protein phosphatase [Rhabdochlamydiaceae bacterium]